MVTHGDLKSSLIAMREFMRRARDREFRDHLGDIGWASDQDVVIAFDTETIASLVSRLALNEASSPCLIAIPHREDSLGFWLLFMEAVPNRRAQRRRQRSQTEPINPETSIGMLYSLLTTGDAYLPGEWTSPVSFSKRPIAA